MRLSAYNIARVKREHEVFADLSVTMCHGDDRVINSLFTIDFPDLLGVACYTVFCAVVQLALGINTAVRTQEILCTRERGGFQCLLADGSAGENSVFPFEQMQIGNELDRIVYDTIDAVDQGNISCWPGAGKEIQRWVAKRDKGLEPQKLCLYQW